jgi:hypothetical protein
MTVKTVQLIRFTGKRLIAWGEELDATCIVRNEVNGWREPWQVVYTMGSTRPHHLPYQPRPFPPGTHDITDIADMPLDSVYWPTWIGTDATQELTEWELDDEDMYRRPKRYTIIGQGYGLHHARYKKGRQLKASTTTLGCINILSPDDAKWLGQQIREAMAYKLSVFLDVPEWEEWE